MYSAKSTELLKRILWTRNGRNLPALVVKPAFDNRYDDTRIVTHDGLSVSAKAITAWGDLGEWDNNDGASVFIDELQFFDAPHFDGDIVEIARDLLARGHNVIANGLDLDIHGAPFLITALFLAMADEVIKLKSACSVCGTAATKTFKTRPGDTIELGSVGLYEPRCNAHWTPQA